MTLVYSSGVFLMNKGYQPCMALSHANLHVTALPYIVAVEMQGAIECCTVSQRGEILSPNNFFAIGELA